MTSISYTTTIVLLRLFVIVTVVRRGTASTNHKGILVVGSLNVDTFLPVERLPTVGENLTLLPEGALCDVPGGKGCNQAIACARLSSSPTKFVGQFGNDDAAEILRSTLSAHNVDISHCHICTSLPSGRGYVMVCASSGHVCAVVSRGSNGVSGWESAGWFDNNNGLGNDSNEEEEQEREMKISHVMSQKRCLLLQREIPEYVNVQMAQHAKKRNRNLIVMQDVGGEDRPMTPYMMSLCDYLLPNETELKRLILSLNDKEGKAYVVVLDNLVKGYSNGELGEEKKALLIDCAKLLQKHGANHILITLGSQGSLLVFKHDNQEDQVLYQKACTMLNAMVDETGAGDCYRAAFAVAMTEGKKSLKGCMEFASAAGALAVTKRGAVPSIPGREEVDELCRVCFDHPNDDDDDDSHGGNTLNRKTPTGLEEALSIPRGGAPRNDNDNKNEDFPLLFGSRLNSMKDRPDLWLNKLDNVRDWVKRQGTIRGLNCVDFNYPQHFHTWTNAEAKVALEEEGLVAGAVCLRYPSPKFARGAMNHPDLSLRREAIDITKQAAQTARDLGCQEVVVWSAFDGYDYPFQVDYDEKWSQIVEAFQECCDAYPDIKWSLEYKPTDENTRFFTVPSTGAALLLVKEIDRPNMGLTLDVGHMLMAGENPAQSIAMVGGDKLFGIQLNDGYTRLAAEDGMMFGSVHQSMALEVMYQLRKIRFRGHLYFDTFPQRTDPVLEAEYNIRQVKKFWKAAERLDEIGIQKVMAEHDALGALKAIDTVLERIP